jgi:hypothetical protein
MGEQEGSVYALIRRLMRGGAHGIALHVSKGLLALANAREKLRKHVLPQHGCSLDDGYCRQQQGCNQHGSKFHSQPPLWVNDRMVR